MSRARETARHYIQKYVDRDSSEKGYEFLHSNMGGSAPGSYCVQIGGYLIPGKGQRCYSCDYILVERDLDGKEVNEVFKLRDIFNECKVGQAELPLTEAGK